MEFILGVRLRRVKEIRERVLPDARGFQDAGGNLKVCEANVDGRRYVVCHNPYEVPPRTRPVAILAALEEKLRNGPKALRQSRLPAVEVAKQYNSTRCCGWLRLSSAPSKRPPCLGMPVVMGFVKVHCSR